MDASCGNPGPSPTEPDGDSVPDGEASRLLEWPQLELERVNSFLTSRLEEIKNTIKDSIRASFSMYDLNLDVNDFPKKAATLEGNHLLSHLNGSSDLQPIDLDMAPLSLRDLKRDLELVNGWEDAAATTTTTATNTSTCTSADVPTSNTAAAKDPIQRLNSTPSLSKLIRVRSPERGPAAGSEATQPGPATPAKPKDEAPDAKNATGAGAKTKKGKKQQQQQHLRQQQQDQQEHALAKPPKAGPESQKGGPESRMAGGDAEKAAKGAGGQKPPSQGQAAGDGQRSGHRKAEDARGPRQHQQNGSVGSSAGSRGKGDGDTNSSTPASSQQQQQQQPPKGKNKKNKNKPDKSNSAIGECSDTPPPPPPHFVVMQLWPYPCCQDIF